jgi:hypothetical protein
MLREKRFSFVWNFFATWNQRLTLLQGIEA